MAVSAPRGHGPAAVYHVASTRKLEVAATLARRKVELFSRLDLVLVDLPDVLAATDVHIVHVLRGEKLLVM